MRVLVQALLLFDDFLEFLLVLSLFKKALQVFLPGSRGVFAGAVSDKLDLFLERFFVEAPQRKLAALMPSQVLHVAESAFVDLTAEWAEVAVLPLGEPDRVPGAISTPMLGHAARFQIPLALWALLESAAMHGIGQGNDGRSVVARFFLGFLQAGVDNEAQLAFCIHFERKPLSPDRTMHTGTVHRSGGSMRALCWSFASSFRGTVGELTPIRFLVNFLRVFIRN